MRLSSCPTALGLIWVYRPIPYISARSREKLVRCADRNRMLDLRSGASLQFVYFLDNIRTTSNMDPIVGPHHAPRFSSNAKCDVNASNH